MAMTQAALIATVRDRFGPKAAITDPVDIAPWLTDWRGRWHGASAAILAPASTQEVAAIVTLAAEQRVALTPQGGNSGMVGGATPPADGSALILSLRRMNRIRRLDAAANLAIAEAGVILETLHHAAADIGRRFPLTLGARGSATIGGLVSTNAGGTQVLRFGTMRRLVAGVEAVLPDGSIHDGLSALKKDNRGYSLDELLIGAEGTLGIVTAAALRLVPALVGRAVAWLGVATPEDALAILRTLERDTSRIEGFEIIPAETLAAVLAHVPGTRAPLAGDHPWHLLVEATATSSDEEPSDSLLTRLLGPLIGTLVEDATIAASEAQADAFWRLRDSISEAERSLGPALQHDISVPVDTMPRFMIEAAAEVERAFPGSRASGFGHLGDGNVHFHVRPPATDPAGWIALSGAAASRLVHDLVVAAGGSISAEHGIGQMKKDELARLGPPSRLAAMHAIKAGLDPLDIMNPGKLID
ncbi:MAG: FAD-binding oxidoreductase [Sphingomicrobium sp.]